MVQQLGAPIALTEDPRLILVPMLGGSQPVTPAPGDPTPLTSMGACILHTLKIKSL